MKVRRFLIECDDPNAPRSPSISLKRHSAALTFAWSLLCFILATVPDAPSFVLLTIGDEYVQLEWQNGISDGGMPIDLYEVST